MSAESLTDSIAQIFHFAQSADWQRAQIEGVYAPPGLSREGFIHAATAAQIPGVIARHLRGGGEKIQLTLDPAALRDSLQWEWSEQSNDLYPHIFGTIPLAAVIAAVHFDPDVGIPVE